MRYYAKTAENACFARVSRNASSATGAPTDARRPILAASAARMNTYASPASKQNLATKLQHANKLCPLFEA